MKKIKITVIIFVSIFLFLLNGDIQSQTSAANKGWAEVKSILKRIKPPVFQKRIYNVLNYGAKGDSVTDNTEAFNKAINECNKKGGGRVFVPAGVYLSGPIHLKSNVDFHLSEGAIVRFFTDPQKYLPLVHTRWEGAELYNYSPLIYAYKQKNVAISGKGVFDGMASNDNWWKWKGKKEYGWKEGEPHQDEKSIGSTLLRQMNLNNVPLEQRIFGEGHYLRPPFVQFYGCERVLIDGLTFKDSPFWFIHPVLSKNITISNLKIIGLGPNNDGCDPESCKDVLIKNCYFDTGDDCIAIKSGRNNDGRKFKTPSENIIIQGCKMKEGHGGVVIGSEISGDCRNVFAEDCVMDSPNLDRALRIKSNSIRGGIIENIYFRNITVGEVNEAVIRLNMSYDPKEGTGTNYPVCRNIFVENVTSNKSTYGLYFDGLKEMPVENVYIKNCKFQNVAKGNRLEYSRNINASDFYINNQLINQLELNEVKK